MLDALIEEELDLSVDSMLDALVEQELDFTVDRTDHVTSEESLDAGESMIELEYVLNGLKDDSLVCTWDVVLESLYESLAEHFVSHGVGHLCGLVHPSEISDSIRIRCSDTYLGMRERFVVVRGSKMERRRSEIDVMSTNPVTGSPMVPEAYGNPPHVDTTLLSAKDCEGDSRGSNSAYQVPIRDPQVFSISHEIDTRKYCLQIIPVGPNQLVFKSTKVYCLNIQLTQNTSQNVHSTQR